MLFKTQHSFPPRAAAALSPWPLPPAHPLGIPLLGALLAAAALVLWHAVGWLRARFFPRPRPPPDAVMAPAYDELAQRLFDQMRSKPDGKWWVAIAGGPGAGKSTLAAAVAARVNAAAGEEVAIVIPMDGFHYSRKQLAAIARQNGPKGPDLEQLLARRGAPWTFGAPALCVALADARQLGTAALPAYSRALSDPIPDAIRLERHHRIVLVEGNYLLLHDDPRWAPLRFLFDERWFVRAPAAVLRERLIARALETWTPEKERRWGLGRTGAAAKTDESDLPNAQLIEGTAKYADLVIDSASA